MGILVKSVSNRVMSAIGRDALLELIMKNVEYEALNWEMKLVQMDGKAFFYFYFYNFKLVVRPNKRFYLALL